MLLEKWKGKKILQITDSDLDGVGCRVVGEYYLSPVALEYRVENLDRQKWDDFDWSIIDNYDIILFTDITPSLEEYNKWISNHEIYIFDHHETAKDELGTLLNYYYDLNKCGAKIFFDEITRGIRVKKIIYQFIELVNTYDLFQSKSRLWKFAVRLHFILYGQINWSTSHMYTGTELYTPFVITQLKKFYSDKIFTFQHWENQLAEKEETKMNNAYKDAVKNASIRIDGLGNKYMFTEMGSKISLVCKRLLDEDLSLTYVIAYGTFLEKFKNEKSTKVSLRSRDFNVREIAEKYDGGGHLVAAGVELPEDVFIKLRKGEAHLV